MSRLLSLVGRDQAESTSLATIDARCPRLGPRLVSRSANEVKKDATHGAWTQVQRLADEALAGEVRRLLQYVVVLNPKKIKQRMTGRSHIT